MFENTKFESPGVEQAVAHLLATSESDPFGTSFPGRHALERIRACESVLRDAHVKAVQQRATRPGPYAHPARYEFRGVGPPQGSADEPRAISCRRTRDDARDGRAVDRLSNLRIDRENRARSRL